MIDSVKSSRKIEQNEDLFYKSFITRVNKTLVHKLHEFLILPCKLMSLYDFDPYYML